MASDGSRDVSSLQLLYVGWVLVICVVLGYFLGDYLDGRWGTEPWLTVAGVMLGTGAGFLELFRSVSRSQK